MRYIPLGLNILRLVHNALGIQLLVPF